MGYGLAQRTARQGDGNPRLRARRDAGAGVSDAGFHVRQLREFRHDRYLGGADRERAYPSFLRRYGGRGVVV